MKEHCPFEGVYALSTRRPRPKGLSCLPVLALIVLLVPSTAAAEDHTAGLRVGIGHSAYYGDDYRDYLDFYDSERTLSLTFDIAAFIAIALNDTFSIQAEISYSRSGGADTEDASPYDGDIKYKDVVPYLEVPILCKAGFLATDDLRVSVFAGPNFRLRVGKARRVLRVDDSDLQDKLEEAGSDEYDLPDDMFAPFIVSPLVGFSLESTGSPIVLALDYRIEVGFMNAVDWSRSAEFKDYSFTVNLSCGFRLQQR
jgi:hypothetical protein